MALISYEYFVSFVKKRETDVCDSLEQPHIRPKMDDQGAGTNYRAFF